MPNAKVNQSTNGQLHNTLFLQHTIKGEKLGRRIIEDARKRRVDLLKSVKKEAENDIIAFKTRREEECCRLEAEAKNFRGDMEGKIESSTQEKLEKLQESVEKNKEKALERLLGAVLDIRPELHTNLRL
ncbi:V-type proton ATPase subunit G 1-like [Babylonia areolata]|uniref:V-type proton ATPase subunit G 1-like n=1 Tax=Babylonia areolata TaxID=304850 RepID=UPI003FD4DC06